jgi:tetratricopeptide (TPR) repeat protein
LLAGCSSISLQSDSILADKPTNIPLFIEIENTPFNPQLEYQCGPSALATLFQFNGLDIQPDTLTQEVYLPEKKGSLQVELIAAARRYNLLPYIIDKSVLALLQELQAGNPVLVLQNLGLNWIPQWHYAVVVGYDLTKDQIILRSGNYQRHINTFSLFEKTWRRSDYWGMVVLPLNKLPETATPFRFLSSTVSFEKLGKLEQAKLAYSTGLKKWPKDKHLLMASGNVHFQLNDNVKAEQQYRLVVSQWPDYAPALNNLAHIKLSHKQYDDAEILIRKAIQYGGRFKNEYQNTLEKILNAKHKIINK